MCSDMCPCDNQAYTDGEYNLLDDSELAEYGRLPFALSGNIQDWMIFTQSDFGFWLNLKETADVGYSKLTKSILQEGGGECCFKDPYTINGHKPPTVSNY